MIPREIRDTWNALYVQPEDDPSVYASRVTLAICRLASAVFAYAPIVVVSGLWILASWKWELRSPAMEMLGNGLTIGAFGLTIVAVVVHQVVFQVLIPYRDVIVPGLAYVTVRLLIPEEFEDL